MLVVTRKARKLKSKPQSVIHIGDNIVIHVMRIEGSNVVIGIEAPKEVPIQRGELRKDAA